MASFLGLRGVLKLNEKRLKTHILLRRGTLEEWETINPVLYTGEMGVALDVGRCKIGNGVLTWKELPFFVIAPDLNEYAKIIVKTKQEWLQQSFVVSERNQIYVYAQNNKNDNNMISARIKIGDGNTILANLPFVDSATKQLLDNHINNLNIHTSLEEKNFWNNKINFSEVQNNTLIFNRN